MRFEAMLIKNGKLIGFVDGECPKSDSGYYCTEREITDYLSPTSKFIFNGYTVRIQRGQAVKKSYDHVFNYDLYIWRSEGRYFVNTNRMLNNEDN